MAWSILLKDNSIKISSADSEGESDLVTAQKSAGSKMENYMDIHLCQMNTEEWRLDYGNKVNS